VIENNGDKLGLKSLGTSLLHNYDGKLIRLSGYIKTENVTEGYAGLWMRLDPQIGFDNMKKRGIKGTTDWEEFEIILPLNPEKTNKIAFGGLLEGKGKMWLDNLQISIDGKTLDNAAKIDKDFTNGSGIVFSDLNNETINNLELLGRVWGFIKYHHPEIAKGSYNWDYELFRFLPSYLNIKNKQERDQLIITWINKYGKIPKCNDCQPSQNDAVQKPNLSWIDDSDLSDTLKFLLKEIYDNRNQNKNHYVTLSPNTTYPNFDNEPHYDNMPYPDGGFRLLALYKYWNIIEYFFPNKLLTNKKWNNVLKEYIPEFITAKDELAYEIAAIKVIGEVND
jgi:hypothetical protein